MTKARKRLGKEGGKKESKTKLITEIREDIKKGRRGDRAEEIKTERNQ